MQPRVEMRDRENDADLARTLIHEYAHALLHFDVDDLLHQYVSTLVGRSFSLTNVLVAEVAEHVPHQILELDSREVVQDSHPRWVKSKWRLSNTLLNL